MKALTGTLVVALVCVVVLVAIYPPDSDIKPPNPRDFTNREVVVYSDDAFTETVSNILKDLTEQTRNFISRAPGGMDLVMFDGVWLTSGEDGAPSSSEIISMLDEGFPLMFVNDSAYFFKQSGLTFHAAASPDNSMTYCLFRDPGGETYMYVYSGDDLDDALISAYEWSDKISTPVLAKEDAAAEGL